MQKARFHGHWQYLFIESICNDVSVLEQNYRYKMMYSPDYAGADSEDVSNQFLFHPSQESAGKVRGSCGEIDHQALLM